MLSKLSKLAGMETLSVSEQRNLKGGMLRACQSSDACCTNTGAACDCGLSNCYANPGYIGGCTNGICYTPDGRGTYPCAIGCS